MTLDEFIKEMYGDVSSFQKTWIEGHKKDPKMYPLEFVDDDTGQWFEQFIAYCSSKGES